MAKARFGMIGMGAAAVAVGVGLGLLAFKGVEKLTEIIALGGTTWDKYTEKLKKASEEQDKALAKIATAVIKLQQLNRETAKALGEAAVSGIESRGGGPEETIRARRQGLLDELEFETQAKLAANVQDIINQKITADQGAQIGIAIRKAAAAEKIKIDQNAAKAFAEIDKDLLEKQKQNFLEGTRAYLEALQARQQLREKIETQASAAAQRQLGGDIFQPFRQADQTKQDMQRVAEGFALLLVDGKRWIDLQDS